MGVMPASAPPAIVFSVCSVRIRSIASYSVWADDVQAISVLLFFFFSSRRRHTRCSRDWSSDVCSSDLGVQDAVGVGDAPVHQARERLAWDRNPLLHDGRLGQRCTHRTLPRRVVHLPAEHNALPAVLIIRLEYQAIALGPGERDEIPPAAAQQERAVAQLRFAWIADHHVEAVIAKVLREQDELAVRRYLAPIEDPDAWCGAAPPAPPAPSAPLAVGLVQRVEHPMARRDWADIEAAQKLPHDGEGEKPLRQRVGVGR